MITPKRIRRGCFHSFPDLSAAIEDFIKIYNENPKPFVWTKKVEEIPEKVNRRKHVMETLNQLAGMPDYPEFDFFGPEFSRAGPLVLVLVKNSRPSDGEAPPLSRDRKTEESHLHRRRVFLEPGTHRIHQ